MFEGGPLGSELLPPDILLAERPGIFIDTVPLPVRLLLFGTGPAIEPLTQIAGNLGGWSSISAILQNSASIFNRMRRPLRSL